MIARNDDAIILQILAGQIHFNFQNQHYIIQNITPAEMLYVYQLYNDALIEAELSGLLSEDEVLEYMINNGWWSPILEKELKKLPEIIENLKVDLFLNYSNFKSTDRTKEKLEKQRQRLNSLYSQKKFLYSITIEYYAEELRLMAKLALGTTIDGERLCTEKSFKTISTQILHKIVLEYSHCVLTDRQIRKLIHNPMWQNVWSASKLNSTPIFNIPSAQLNDNQHHMLNVSRMYDSVYEHPERPPQIVIDDDDMLDGWLTFQSRKNSKDREKAQAEKNFGHTDANEVFIVVDRPEDAQRVRQLNKE